MFADTDAATAGSITDDPEAVKPPRVDPQAQPARVASVSGGDIAASLAQLEDVSARWDEQVEGMIASAKVSKDDRDTFELDSTAGDPVLTVSATRDLLLKVIDSVQHRFSRSEQDIRDF